MISVNIAQSEASKVEVTVVDSYGKLAFSKSYSIDGSFNTILAFDEPLAMALYTIEFKMNDGTVKTERMLVTK